MDEQYFLHVEDVDFCKRFRAVGGSVYFDPEIRVVHFAGSSDTPAVSIDKYKAASFSRYFKTHFSGRYPELFLWGLGLDVGRCTYAAPKQKTCCIMAIIFAMNACKTLIARIDDMFVPDLRTLRFSGQAA